MPLEKTVILGEASEESDTEEITLDDDKKPKPTNVTERNHNESTITTTPQRDHKTKTGGIFGSSILSSIASTSTIAKLVNYSPYGLLISAGPQYGQSTTIGSSQGPNVRSSSNPSESSHYHQLPILHRALYTRNQQLYACLNHLYKHPFEKASKNVHTISQRLVTAQRGLQEVDVAILKIKREQKNLDININMIV